MLRKKKNARQLEKELEKEVNIKKRIPFINCIALEPFKIFTTLLNKNKTIIDTILLKKISPKFSIISPFYSKTIII